MISEAGQFAILIYIFIIMFGTNYEASMNCLTNLAYRGLAQTCEDLNQTFGCIPKNQAFALNQSFNTSIFSVNPIVCESKINDTT